MTPERGYAAEFGFSANNITFLAYANVVRHDGAYMVRVSMPGVPLSVRLIGVIASFMGDVHGLTAEGQPLDAGPFLTNPSSCTEGPLDASVEANTWEHPETFMTRSATVYPSLEGCEELAFAPAFSATPETTQAASPSGYKVGVEVPQGPQFFGGTGTPPLRDVSVTLPAGVTISPSSANGLGACQETGAQGINIEGAESEAIGADGLPRPTAGHCPAASRIGTVKATTPLLSETLEGHIFLAAPKCGGAGQPECTTQDAQDGKLYGLYLELEGANAGVNIKLAGSASVNPTTGQVTATFDDNPQFPVSDLVVETTGGPRAPLANPETCGAAVSNAQITPWSSTTPTSLTSTFNVDSDGAGGACPASSPFAPTFSAGTSSTLAGANTPFTLTLKREDGEQNIASLSSTLPAGLLASVANVAQCAEPQAAAGACPASSQVGTTTVSVGPGSDPYYETGQVYFTGPYAGAPFGLSVVVPAVAGPFNLGHVIVRVALFIDPHTAQVTAVSSPFPQILDGVPLHVRTVNVTLNAQKFTFNPTSCAQLKIAGTVSSTAGATAAVSSPFAAGGCKNLPFKPGFSASVAGAASKLGGASLDVKVSSKGGPQANGEEANIGAVKVDLPIQLPSRQSTLKLACLAATFEANSANCPKESDVGAAVVHTPVLAHPLIGPAYLVSHGGAAFPDLEMVLQGEGVTLILDGNTVIKKGVTSSIFKTVPDAPISSFELKLPAGKFSILAANLPAKAKYNFCGQSLSMPTEITGQNGVVVKQTTKVAITGCAPAPTRAQKLAKALKLTKALIACRKQAKGAKRVSCEAQARKKYGPSKRKG